MKIPICQADRSVKSLYFSLFLPCFTHLFTALFAWCSKKRNAIVGPTVKQFYNKAQKGRDFLVPFSHDLACKV